jgi:eukaryotic-like serine/threonine-protein kinase
MAEALEYVYEKGVVHRDLKPANIKVTHDGLVKLLDFRAGEGFRESMQRV